jgi:hypothetical protein
MQKRPGFPGRFLFAVIASEAKQSIARQAEAWIASSLALLAMTLMERAEKTTARTPPSGG